MRRKASFFAGAGPDADALPGDCLARVSSVEFDAALIAERRAAGVYGPRRHRKQMLATAAGLAVIIFLTV